MNAPEAPRYGQLTYSSFDLGGDAGGGWQVKETGGVLTSAEAEEVRGRIATRFEPVEAIPAFPEPDQIAALPRRLVYLPMPGGQVGYWHTAPAGSDASGRPGNVFVHCLLDRRPWQAGPLVRPVDLWRSPDWSAPFGPRQVLAATLAGCPVATPGVATSPEEVLRFLMDPDVYRLDVLAVLLDAVHARLLGTGARVVLAVTSDDEAALWIGAVSRLMSAGAARHLSFSTGERAAWLGAPTVSGLDVVAVPRGDLPIDPDAFGVVVLDTAESVDVGALRGAPHHTAAGSLVTVTPWSVLATEVLQDLDLARRVLSRLDAIASAVGDDALAPPWPLAAAVAEVAAQVPDAADAAADVLLSTSPPSLREHPDLLASASALVGRSVGESAAAAWAVLERAPASSVLPDLLVDTYLERALADRAWLTRPGGVPCPQLTRSGPVNPHLAALAREHVSALTRSTPAPHGSAAAVESAVLLLRWVDLVVRSDVLALTQHTAADGAVSHEIDVLLDHRVSPLLVERECAVAIASGAGPLAARTQSPLVRNSLGQTMERMTHELAPVGERIPVEVLAWLFPDPPTFAPDRAGWENELDRPLLLEYAVQVAQGAPLVSTGDPRPLALWGLRDGPNAAARGRLRLLDPVWDVADLLPVIRELGIGVVPEDAVVDALVVAKRGPQLGELASAVLQSGRAGRVARSTASIREQTTHRWWLVPQGAGDAAQSLLVAVLDVLDARPGARFADEVVPHLLTAVALGLVERPARRTDHTFLRPALEEWVDRGRAFESAAERLREALAAGALHPARTAAVAVAGTTELMSSYVSTPATRLLATVTSGSVSGVPLLELVVREHYLLRRPAVDPRDLQADIEDELRELLRERRFEESEAEGVVADAERHLRQWCRALLGREGGGGDDGGVHGALRRFRRS